MIKARLRAQEVHDVCAVVQRRLNGEVAVLEREMKASGYPFKGGTLTPDQAKMRERMDAMEARLAKLDRIAIVAWAAAKAGDNWIELGAEECEEFAAEL